MGLLRMRRIAPVRPPFGQGRRLIFTRSSEAVIRGGKLTPALDHNSLSYLRHGEDRRPGPVDGVADVASDRAFGYLGPGVCDVGQKRAPSTQWAWRPVRAVAMTVARLTSMHAIRPGHQVGITACMAV